MKIALLFDERMQEKMVKYSLVARQDIGRKRGQVEYSWKVENILTDEASETLSKISQKRHKKTLRINGDLNEAFLLFVPFYRMLVEQGFVNEIGHNLYMSRENDGDKGTFIYSFQYCNLAEKKRYLRIPKSYIFPLNDIIEWWEQREERE